MSANWSADPTNWKGTPQTKSFSFSETKDGKILQNQLASLRIKWKVYLNYIKQRIRTINGKKKYSPCFSLKSKPYYLNRHLAKPVTSLELIWCFNSIPIISESSYCFSTGKTIIDCLITTTLSLSKNIKQPISKTAKESYSLWNRHLIIFNNILQNLLSHQELICWFNCILVISIKSTPLKQQRKAAKPSPFACATYLSI